MTDISTIMVEAAEAERAKWMFSNRDGDGNYAILTYPGRVVAFTGTAIECDAYYNQQVVQAQLRALHDAGYGIGQITAHGTGDDWRVEGPDLVTAALNHHAQPDADQDADNQG
jgi:hypothetical protein